MWLPEIFLISKNKITVIRTSFSGHSCNSATIIDTQILNSKKSAPAVLPAVVQMLDPLHNHEMGLI